MTFFTDDTKSVALDVDTRATARAVVELEQLSTRFARTLSGAFSDLVVKGRNFDDVMRSLSDRVANMAINAAFKPVEALLSNGLNSIVSGAPAATGTAPATPHFFPFAKGGVVASPTPFQFSGGALGVAGEAGPEAILPLKRGADGRLGVASAVVGGSPRVVVNITTPDVEGFRRSEAQVASALSRAVGRGQRNL